jgi:hypothetical protein
MTWPPKLPFDKWKNLYREKDGRIVLCFPMLSGEDEAGTLPIAIDRLGSFQLYMTIDVFAVASQ